MISKTDSDRVAARINFGDSAAHAPVSVSVLDPEKVANGAVSSHIAFTVRCSVTASFADWAEGVVFVKRRFRDFVWLDGALADAFPGALRPPLPPSSVVGVDVDERRRLLEVYMTRLLRHPELSFARTVQVFCCCPDDGSLPSLSPFAEFVAEHRRSAEAAASASSPAAAEASSIPSGQHLDSTMMEMLAKQTPLDAKLESEAEGMRKLGCTLESVVKQAEHASLKQRHLAQQLFAAGLSFSLLAKTEASQQQQPHHPLRTTPHTGNLLNGGGGANSGTSTSVAAAAGVVQGGSCGEALRCMGRCCDGVSVRVAEAATQDAASLLKPLKEHIALLSAAGTVLAQRACLRQQAREAAEVWVARADTARQRRKRADEELVQAAAAAASAASSSSSSSSSAAAAAAAAAAVRTVGASGGGQESTQQYSSGLGSTVGTESSPSGGGGGCSVGSGGQLSPEATAAASAAGSGDSSTGAGSSLAAGGGGGASSASLRAEQAEAAAGKAAGHAVWVRRQLSLMDERLFRELDRFKREKATEVRAALILFCRQRAAHAKAQEELWREAQPVLHASHLALDPHSAQLALAAALNTAALNTAVSHHLNAPRAGAPAGTRQEHLASSAASGSGTTDTHTARGSNHAGSGNSGGRAPAVSEDWNEASV